MALSNNWVTYIDRSYEQIRAQVKSKITNALPELTDHTENNVFIRMISIWAGIAEMIGYYVDNAAREAHLSSVRLFDNAVSIARMHDYRIKGRSTAQVELLFSLSQVASSDINVPQGTVCETDSGIQFRTLSGLTIPAGDLEGTVEAEQKDIISTTIVGTSDGSAGQTFDLNERVVDSSVIVTISNTNWTARDSLGWSDHSDTHFVQRINRSRVMELLFGDDRNGAIPANGDDIEAEWEECEGAEGNVGLGTITNIVPSISTPTGVEISVTNPQPATGGTDQEGIEEIRRFMPLAMRTLYRAVSERDHRDVTVLYNGVEEAQVDFDCGKTFPIYIVPSGGGMASASLVSDVQSYLDKRKMVTTFPQVKPAGEVHVIVEADIVVDPAYGNTSVSSDVEQNIADLLSFQDQEIGGLVALGNIYEAIENTEGVRYGTVNLLNTVPYARPLGHTTQLNWTRQTQPGSTTTVKWMIRYQGSGNYELFKDGAFIGVHAVGATVSLPEVVFVINSGSYTAGQSWEFYTYPYDPASIDLKEPSIPVANTGDITIYPTGGT